MAQSIFEILLKIEGDAQLKSSLNEVGVAAGLSGAALTAFSAGAAKMAADYETALANVSTVSDSTTGSTQEFSQALFDLQSDMDGAINVQDAAVASYDILSAGIKDQDAVLSALANSQKAAIAGQSNLTAISKAAVSVVNSYGESLGVGADQAAQFDKAINLIIRTQLDGVITGDEYANSIGQIAALAKVSGLSLEELNSIIAVTTAKGIPASISFTNLKAAISNVNTPTKQATDEAARLGIQFDATRLQAVGLSQILQDVANSGKANAATLSQLFGSTEAQASVAILLDNLGQLETAYDSQVNGLETLDAAYSAFTGTTNQDLTNSLNKLQASLILLGQGVLIAAGPFIDLLTQITNILTKLDPNIIKFAGSITLATGVLLTINGAVLLTVVQMSSLIASLKTLSGIMTTSFLPAILSTTASLKAKIIALNLANKSLSALLVKVGIAALPFVALAAAIGTATLALKAYQEGEKALKFEAIRGQQVETQKLADAASGLGLRIQETGKAIPDEEFNSYIAVLKDANEGNGTLTSTIEALERMQAKAKSTTTATTDATADSADAAGDAADAFDDYAASIQNQVTASETLFSQQAQSIAQSGASQSAVIKETLAAAEESTATQIALLEDLASQSATTGEERVAIESEINQKKLDLQKERIEAQKALEELYNQFLIDSANLALTNFEQSQLDQNATVEAGISQRKALTQEVYLAEKAALESTLADTIAGSAERRAIEVDLANLKLSHTREQQALDQQATDAALANISQIFQAQSDLLNLQTQAFEIRSDALSVEADLVNEIAGIYSSINGLLTNDNTTLAQRSEILDMVSDLAGEELSVQGALQFIQREQAQLEMEKLELKRQQLLVDREALVVAGQLKQLEIQSERDSIAAQLPTANANERQSLTNRDAALARQSQLENQRTAIAASGIDNQLAITGIEAAIASILSRNQQGPTARDLNSRQSLNQARGEGLITKEEYDAGVKKLEDQAKKDADEKRKAEDAKSKRDESQLQATTETTAATTETTTATQGQLETTKATNAALSNLVEINQSILDVNRGQLERLNRMSAQLDALPGAIAARLPRPTSQPSTRR